jgi:hypothetical protein
MSQNYSNHRKFVPAYHYVLLLLILILIGITATNLVEQIMACRAGACTEGGCCWVYGGLVPFLMAIALLITAALMRQFSTKVQDRAIHAEESLRYFILTGKPVDPRLTWPQIIALRFAGDDEYLSLKDKAIAENMKPDDIKKEITHWREDNHRC